MRGKKNIRSHRPKVSRRGKNQSRFIKGKFSTDTVKVGLAIALAFSCGVQRTHQTCFVCATGSLGLQQVTARELSAPWHSVEAPNPA